MAHLTSRGDDRGHYVLGGGTVRKAQHHDVDTDQVFDAFDEARALRRSLGPRDVVGDDVVTALDQVVRENRAHAPQTDDADVHDVRAARTLRTLRRAETPAGPPA